MLLVYMYVACLVAALTTEEPNLPFRDLKGLTAAVERNEFKICVGNGSAFYGSIMNSPSPEFTVLRKYLAKNPDFATGDCITKLKNNDNMAYPEEVDYLENLQKRNCTDFPMVILEDRFFPGYLALGLQKGSKLNMLLSNSITEIVDSGLVDKWKQKYAPVSTQCDIQEANTVVAMVKKIVLADVTGPFIIFLIGILISALVALMERMWTREHKERRSVLVQNPVLFNICIHSKNPPDYYDALFGEHVSIKQNNFIKNGYYHDVQDQNRTHKCPNEQFRFFESIKILIG